VAGLIGLWPVVLVGVAAGILGGMFGIGGGLVMVPALILLFGYDQRTSSGTSLLAQLLPVGLLGVAEYWRRNEVRVGPGLGLAVGLLVGMWLGGLMAGLVPKAQMKQAYGVFLVCVGVYFLFVPEAPRRIEAEIAAEAQLQDQRPPERSS
jgi:uncharacterized membrane protein YfcA